LRSHRAMTRKIDETVLPICLDKRCILYTLFVSVDN
jgi:hypothetical protein